MHRNSRGVMPFQMPSPWLRHPASTDAPIACIACITTYSDTPKGTLATTLGVPGSEGAMIVPPPLPRDLPELR